MREGATQVLGNSRDRGLGLGQGVLDRSSFSASWFRGLDAFALFMFFLMLSSPSTVPRESIFAWKGGDESLVTLQYEG